MTVIPEPFALSSYAYDLPPELIAQTPVEPRDAARLLVLDRSHGTTTHSRVFELPGFLRPGDLVVVNRSRVLPCRLIGRKERTGGRVELLFLRPTREDAWEALVGGHRIPVGQRVRIAPGVTVVVGEPTLSGRIVRIEERTEVLDVLHRYGIVPLPPYIHGYEGELNRYQTIYGDVEGSAAAPTAGLHFTLRLKERLVEMGVGWQSVVLHVGLDTFKPVAEEDVREHRIHTEWVEVDESVVAAIGETRKRGGRVLAVGTTTVRALEHAAASGSLEPYQGPADLFITPGYQFRAVDLLLTNFHLPHSTLLLLVSALAGREALLSAYAEAVRLRYRFLSFGDAMLIC